ncbi:hypothetical protein Bca101_018465 [Brassica carinata]
MAKLTLLRPQFFHTLLPGFQTQLMIPSDFFSNYIKETSLDSETTTAELKSDSSSSDLTWKVKLTGRILNDGWGDFAVANNLRIGNVVLVKYEGDMVFHVSDLGPSCSLIQHIDDDDDGRFLLRKHPRTDDFEEVPLNKKGKINSNKTKADSSSSVHNSCFVASLHTDTLCIPQHFTSSNAHTRNCCEAHSTELSNEEEDIERERKEDESLMDIEKKKFQQKQRPVSYSSCSPCHKRFVTFTLPPDYATICRLTLPNLFVKENGINKPGEICMLGKDGTKWPISLLLDKKGIVSLGKGWKEFVKANGLETGFTLKLMWEDRRIRDKISKYENNKEEKRSWEREEIHLGGRYIGDFEEVPINKKVKTDSHGTEADCSSLDNSCFVAFVTDWSLDSDTLYLPRYFTSSNGLTRKCRKIVLIDGGGRSWELDLSFNESSDIFYISPGWRSFCDENGLEAGGFFTFKLVGNGETPVLSFCPMESIDSRRQTDCFEAHSTEVSNEEEDIERKRTEGETLVAIEKKCRPKPIPVSYSSYSPCYKRFVTFTLPPDYATLDKLTLPKLFVKENGINKPGEIYLLGKDGTKWLTRLLLDKKGLMRLGKGWKDFVKANGVESGFTLRLLWEDTTPLFSLCCAESTGDKDQEKYLEVIKQRSLSIDRRIKDKISKDENNKEEKRSLEREKIKMRGRDSTTSSQKQFLTLAISPTSLRCHRLRIPIPFLRESSMDKPGVIYLLGKDDKKWMANLIQEGDGRMKLGKGWRAFAKENEFKPGESVTLESIWEDETPMIRFLLTESESSKANKKESIYAGDTEPRTRDSSSAIHDRFVTLTLTDEDVKACMLILPSQFLKANGINKLGKITILDENGVELSAYLLSREGIVALESGWASSSWLPRELDKLIQRGRTLILRLSSRESESEEESNFGFKITAASVSFNKNGTTCKGKAHIVHARLVSATGGATAHDLHLSFLPITPRGLPSGKRKDYSGVAFLPQRRVRWRCLPISLTLFSVSFQGLWLYVFPQESEEEDCTSEANELKSLPQHRKEVKRSTKMKETRRNVPKGMIKRVSPNALQEDEWHQYESEDGQERFLSAPSSWLPQSVDNFCSLLRQTEDGRKLTDGWKEFALAHNLRIGDILIFIFRQEKDMAFHVTLFGPSCCENQYESCLDNENNIRDRKNPKREAECSSDPSCFVSNVMPSTLRYYLLNLPKSFVRENGQETRCGENVLMNEKGRSWTLALKQRQCGRSYITRGWRSFCSASGLKVGDFFTFKTHQKRRNTGSTDEERYQDEKSLKKKTRTTSQCPKVCTVSSVPFTDRHGITVGTNMSLLDKQGVKWCTVLRSEEDTSCVLKFCSKGLDKLFSTKKKKNRALDRSWEGKAKLQERRLVY